MAFLAWSAGIRILVMVRALWLSLEVWHWCVPEPLGDFWSRHILTLRIPALDLPGIWLEISSESPPSEPEQVTSELLPSHSDYSVNSNTLQGSRHNVMQKESQKWDSRFYWKVYISLMQEPNNKGWEIFLFYRLHTPYGKCILSGFTGNALSVWLWIKCGCTGHAKIRIRNKHQHIWHLKFVLHIMCENKSKHS